jgi:hypothetical protein
MDHVDQLENQAEKQFQYTVLNQMDPLFPDWSRKESAFNWQNQDYVDTHMACWSSGQHA